VPEDELATGAIKSLEIQTQRVSLQALGSQPVELAYRKLEIFDGGVRPADRISEIPQVTIGDEAGEGTTKVRVGSDHAVPGELGATR
jgi:hypothetical protein